MNETLLTPEIVAKSWQVSTAFIYKLVREKKIPYFHIGKSIRFSPQQIEEFLKGTMNGEYHRDRLKRNNNGKKEG
jgi:excisionase family DNA binding protein